MVIVHGQDGWTNTLRAYNLNGTYGPNVACVDKDTEGGCTALDKETHSLMDQFEDTKITVEFLVGDPGLVHGIPAE